MKLFRIVMSLILGLALSSGAHAVFKQREDRWAAQIQETLLIGEPVWLTARQKKKDEKFFAIYTPASNGPAKGAVLIMHGQGRHPDWPEVISPLRRQLPERGWTTLSLQMPLLPAGAPAIALGPLFEESPARIRAGLEFLRAKGAKRIVLLGHELGAAMGAAFLAKEQPEGVSGFVGVALEAPTTQSTIYTLDPRLYTPNSLAKITLPVLDIYGGHDHPNVTETDRLRAAAAQQAGNKHYEQSRFPDADHYFTGYEDDLVDAVQRWLDQSAHVK